MKLILKAILPAFVALMSLPALSQSDWPNRPITIVLAIGSGSGTDLGLRLYAARLSQRLGVSVVVENRAGASTIMGTEYAMRQAPNGYNLVSLFTTTTIVPSTHKNVPFDPLKDFVPISTMASSSFGFAVRPSMNVKNIRELVALAKANPGKYTFASPGHGTPHHLGMELLKLQNGVDILHVPHKGIGEALNGLNGGHTDMMISVAAGLVPHVKAGRMVMIGVTGKSKLPVLPEVLTAGEQGAAYLNALNGWFGLAAPLKTPQPILTRLNAEVNAIASQADFIAELAKSGQEADAGTPEEMTEKLKLELATWARVVRDAKIPLQ